MPGTEQQFELSNELMRMLRESLRTMKFGTVTLVIQDGRVVQVEKNEKFRMAKCHMDGSGI